MAVGMDGPRVAIVLGTRPEIIKLAGVARCLGARGYLVHTGQHYDQSLSGSFLDGYGLATPEVTLEGVGGATRAEQFAVILRQLTAAFTQERPGVAIVQGDTNTAAAAAMAASFLDIPVVHVEAGLRSYDRAMPEEINRQLVGVVADLHCAPTETSARHLRAEGVDDDRIIVTGNTVVEATREMLPGPEDRAKLLHRFQLDADGYVLATIHRPENTDDPVHLRWILEALAAIDQPVVIPLHPRTVSAARRFGLLDLLDGLRAIDPVDHPTFLGLARHARLLVSDSGGVQEECTVLKRPLLVVRHSTERPEAVDAGFARRVAPSVALAAVMRAAVEDTDWLRLLDGVPSPYGDGTASIKIAHAVRDLLGTHLTPEGRLGRRLIQPSTA